MGSVMGHKQLGARDIKSWFLPFPPEQFRRIVNTLQLPIQYLHIRSKGGTQCGGCIFNTSRDDGGRITRISSIIRPAHGSSINHSSNWGFTTTWDACTGRTTAILDGMTKHDVKDLKDYLKAASPLLRHPLALPEILLHMIQVHLNERIRAPEEEAFFKWERKTGISRINASPEDNARNIWDWKFPEFTSATNAANKFNTTICYLTRRFAFATQLAKRQLELLKELESFKFVNADIEKEIRNASWSRKERLQNRIYQLETYEHQVHCMGERNKNLVTVLYTVLSQKDSSTQVAIARAVRIDSTFMRTIAYLTLVFLPGAYIATIFGMNFFGFDSQTRRLVVSDTFWHYWVVNVPFTLAVMLVWKVLVLREQERARKEAEGRGSNEAAEEGHDGALEGTQGRGMGSKELLRSLKGLRKRIGKDSGVVEEREVDENV
ncbi:hypothetical protein BDV96DRAFT_305680 [Lophiotrema nucula]|uniref:Uncharacterized protein n=1 Tax=Lophiotrema nucula TaxID=690887 RepID=A0A6A5YJG9_9PLEO|nr:hypothetical protein BDV96DRAFT_305680 [Lophiotrema nucula]